MPLQQGTRTREWLKLGSRGGTSTPFNDVHIKCTHEHLNAWTPMRAYSHKTNNSENLRCRVSWNPKFNPITSAPDMASQQNPCSFCKRTKGTTWLIIPKLMGKFYFVLYRLNQTLWQQKVFIISSVLMNFNSIHEWLPWIFIQTNEKYHPDISHLTADISD